MPAKRKHRGIPVGKDNLISLCETCKHMPSGVIPQTNEEVMNKSQKRPFMMCLKKAFLPKIEYDNEGNPFYDVASCDGYEDFKPTKQKSKTPQRHEDTKE